MDNMAGKSVIDMDSSKSNFIVNQLRSLRYIWFLIRDLNLEIEAIEHRLTGLARSQEAFPDNKALMKYPMPRYHGGNHSPLGLIAEVDELKNKRDSLLHHFEELRCIQLLSSRDLEIVLDIYYYKIGINSVVCKYNFTSRQSLMKYINKEISEII